MIYKLSRVAAFITISLSTVIAGSPENSEYPDPNNPFVHAFLQSTLQDPYTQEFDSTMLAMRAHPDFRYPGKALMYSLILPGGGQLYLGQWKRAIFYLVLESAAIVANSQYHRQGEDQVNHNKDFANAEWDFVDWIKNAETFNPEGAEVLDFGAEGSHGLDFYILDANGGAESFRAGDNNEQGEIGQQEMYTWVTATYKGRIFVKLNGEYYENIGKYEQFHTGWEDYDSSWVIEAKSGLGVHSVKRDFYLSERRKANRLLSAASYTLSALMFNHVVSGVDAIFSASRRNRRLVSKLHGSLLYAPDNPGGIGGIKLSIDL